MKKYDQFFLWFFGESIYENEFQQVSNRLAVFLNLAAISFAILNIAIVIIIKNYGPVAPLSFLASVGILGMLFFRLRLFLLGKVFILSIYFFCIYLSAAANVYESGNHLYFLVLGLSSFVVFGYEKLLYGIAFALLAVALYFLSYFSDFTIIPEYNLSDEKIGLIFIINVLCFSALSMIVVIVYMRMTYHQSKVIEQKNQNLNKTNKELDQFLYTTSHDLRAPLATLLGLLHITRKTKDLEEKEQYEKLMETSIYKMEEFIEDIIHFFKNSRLPIQSDSITPDVLVNDVFNELENQANLNNVELRINESSDAPIVGDQMRIKNILRNLLSNGIKYSDGSKDKKFVEVSILPNGKTIDFAVKDNGMGINRNHLDKVFDMFYRASENSKGSGLGLYIAHETAQNLGGELSVISDERKGSTFKLRIPKNNAMDN